MKVIHFTADGQKLTVDESDTFGIIKGSRRLYATHFKVNQDWDACRLVAEFGIVDDKNDFVPVVRNYCEVPELVLDSHRYTVRLIGVREDGYTITTNKVWITQGG